METWREKILEQFVPNVSKLSLVSDPDNLLIEEKTAVILRNRGFDILEFNNAIEFRYAYESQYRTIWDKGLQTELVVIIHTQKADLNYLPYDLLETGKKLYFNIDEIFPVFSPYILKLLDKSFLDTLDLYRDKFPKDKQGDKYTIDFLLRYVYKIDIDTVNNEIDLIKYLLHIHFNNFEIPLEYLQRLEDLLSKKKKIASLPIKSLLNNKDYFTEYLMEMHKEIIDSSPLIQFIQVYKKDTKKIDALLKYLENEGIEDYLNHKEWINLAWKFAHLTSFIYQNSNSGYLEQLESVYSKVNKFYEKWLTANYTGLRTIPSVSPAMVHHVPHYLAHHYHLTKKPVALIVIDGLALNQWVTLRDSLTFTNIRFIENALFSWIPTLTSISRQSIFAGKNPYEYESSIHTTEKEEKFWYLFWENNGLERQNIIYLKGIDSNEKIVEFNEKLEQNRVVIMGIVLNKIDKIMHGMEMGMEGFHNQIMLYGKNGQLSEIIMKFIERGFEVWITSDHGNTECIGHGQPHEASIAKSRGERARIYKSENLLESVKKEYPWTDYWKPIGLPNEYFPLVAKENYAFLPQNTHAISHGGISMQETIVPFIRVLRK
jgi:hypothetical protein